MVENINALERSIIDTAPQIPYVVDQLGFAMNWAKEVQDEGAYLKTLKFALKVAEFAQKTSHLNYYKTYLVVAAILMDIEDATENSKFEIFKSTSNSVENSIKAIRIDPELSKEYGCFKALSMQVNNLAKTNQDCFVIVMNSILADLEEVLMGMKGTDEKSPITTEDYIKVLGYALVLQNLRFAKFDLYETSQEVINKVSMILSSEINY